jgi:glycosyltransferase involved in cell wall biosynthesis
MGQDVLPENRRFLKLLSAARIVAVSDFQNDVFEKNTSLWAAHVIPWGVNEDEISAGLSAERPLDVLGVGSLIAVKDWEKWLNVIAFVAQTFPDLTAEMIGDGPERTKLERLAQQLGLGKNVRFVGNLPRPEVLMRMRETKVLLHTARFESFGYVLAEAAMNGCRVASTPVGTASHFGKTAENERDLATLVLQELRTTAVFEPFTPLLMKETAAAYLQLYAQK